MRLLWPPFSATPRDPGYIKAYPPGIRENSTRTATPIQTSEESLPLAKENTRTA